MPDETPAFLYVGNRRKGPTSWVKAPTTGFGFGIHRFDHDSGRLTYVKTVADDVSVGACLYDRRRGVIYALHESLTLPGHHLGGGGQVVAFKVNPHTGDLTELSRRPSFGTLPASAALDSRGEFLVVVHHTAHTPITRTEQGPDGAYRIVLDYDDAGTVLFPLADDGAIAPPADIFRHGGQGALPAQTHPQLHCVARAPGQDLFVVCDKGADRIHFFGIDRAARKLVHHAARTIMAPPGSSPRYCVFHPQLPVFYVNFETAPVLHAYRYAPDGAVTLIQAVSPLPDDVAHEPDMMQSDLVLHPNGRYLYDLVRGLECASTFEVHAQSGMLTRRQTQPLGVNNARGAAISPDGRHLLVAAVLSQDVRVWRLGTDGRLAPESTPHPQPNPGCLLFA